MVFVVSGVDSDGLNSTLSVAITCNEFAAASADNEIIAASSDNSVLAGEVLEDLDISRTSTHHVIAASRDQVLMRGVGNDSLILDAAYTNGLFVFDHNCSWDLVVRIIERAGKTWYS